MGEQGVLTPWPREPLEARVAWKHGGGGQLHFYAPDGQRAAIPIHGDASRAAEAPTPLWHCAVAGDVIMVAPAIRVQGRWESPNPVRFRRVDELTRPTGR